MQYFCNTCGFVASHDHPIPLNRFCGHNDWLEVGDRVSTSSEGSQVITAIVIPQKGGDNYIITTKSNSYNHSEVDSDE